VRAGGPVRNEPLVVVRQLRDVPTPSRDSSVQVFGRKPSPRTSGYIPASGAEGVSVSFGTGVRRATRATPGIRLVLRHPVDAVRAELLDRRVHEVSRTREVERVFLLRVAALVMRRSPSSSRQWMTPVQRSRVSSLALMWWVARDRGAMPDASPQRRTRSV
jgi:hypothetical protein